MSGVLLSVAMYAILRVQAVGGAHIGVGLVHGLLIAFGLLSLAVAAFLTLTQRDYKRLLAYSSIEHMGIIALGVGSGTTLGLTAALLHMLGHGVVKAAMFVVAGRVLNVTGSSRIADVTGLLKRRPDLGWPFLVGSAALLGFPPFVTFFTEVAILVALTQAGLWWAAGGAALLLLVTFVGIARQVLGMTVGAPGTQDHAGDHSLVDDPPRWFRTAPVAIALASGAVVSFLALVFVPVLGAAAAALGVAR
jgi:hydrogenase-4 component F